MLEYSVDVDYGLMSENDMLPFLEFYFKTDLVKSSSKYCKYDYKGEGIKIELKTRRVSHDDFPTTFVNSSKIDYVKTLADDTEFYFVFKYTDGIYYIKYDRELFDTFHQENTTIHSRGYNIINTLIPICYLTSMNS
jgi:hypothetical protein